jgi:hypothetical protein
MTYNHLALNIQMEKTYLELLAENDAEARQEFEPNAKELFIQHQEYDDIQANGKEHDELEDQEAFQQYAGSHQQAAAPPDTQRHPGVQKTDHSYRSKFIKTHVINIDSRFRDDLTTLSTNFQYRLPVPIKNSSAMRISSLEIPNTWYTISCTKYNNGHFYITYYDGTANPEPIQVKFEDGNYEDAETFSSILESRFEEIFGAGIFTVILSLTNGKITIKLTNPTPTQTFTLDFTAPNTTRPFQNGIGYNLGFRKMVYSGKQSYTAEAIFNMTESPYIFLSVGGHNIIEHKTFDGKLSAFAKVIVDVPKFSFIFDNGSNTVTKEYIFPQPTNIVLLKISLFDLYENILELNGFDFSITIEIDEIINTGLYQTTLDVLN